MFDTEIHIEKYHHHFPHFIFRAIAGVFFGVLFALLFGIFVQMLWNWLVPNLFHLGTITYLQAFGLMILARLIFGGFRHHGEHHRHFAARHWEGRRGRPRHWDWHSRGCFGRDDIEDWQHYDEWWQSEGKDAFKKYAGSRTSGSAESVN